MSEHRDKPVRQSVPSWAKTVRPGHFDARGLRHEFWIDVDAHVRYLDELSTLHLQAIVQMLTERSRVLYGAELIDTYLRVVIGREQGMPAGEQLAFDLGQPTIADLEPTEWLETTALVRAIRRILRARG